MKNEEKAKVLMDFVETIAMAHFVGFIDRNTASIAEIYHAAKSHCKDEFGVDVPKIDDAYTKDLAEACRSYETKHTKEI